MRMMAGLALLAVLLVGAERAGAQAQSPAYPVTFGMQSVLETYFGETGIVSFGEYDAAFVPESGLNAEVVLADAEGTILARFPFHDSYRFTSQVFARIGVVGPADVQLTEPGVYNIFFLVDGEITTRMPFVLQTASDGSDPFDPEKTFTYGGFWQQLGYLTAPGSSGYQGPQFTFWTGGPDLADKATGEGYVAVLYQDDTILFHGQRTTGHIAPGAFARSSFVLFHPHGEGEEANARLFTAEDLAALDGDYVLRVFRSSDNAPIRAFNLTVADGKLVQHPRAVLGYQPQMDFILPRVPHAGSSAYEMVEAIWFESGG